MIKNILLENKEDCQDNIINYQVESNINSKTRDLMSTVSYEIPSKTFNKKLTN